jgi:hypothetical protein
MKKYQISFTGSFDMVANNQEKAHRRALEILDGRLLGIGRRWDEYEIDEVLEIEK